MTHHAQFDRKLFAKAERSVKRLNGHPTPENSLIKECSQQLKRMCPVSFVEYSQMGYVERRRIRRAVRSALELKETPTDEIAYGEFRHMIGHCEDPMSPNTNRGRLSRLLHYFASST